jgi:hypothetical protein
MGSAASEARAVLGAALAVSVAAAACTTTHALGRLDDPAARARAQDVIAHETTYAAVTPVSSASQERPRAVALTAAGLELEPSPRATHVVVPATQLRYLSTYDHGRGARDGALALGIPAFLVGFTAGIVLLDAWSSCSDGACGGSSSTSDVLKVGLAFGGIAGFLSAAAGACIGALVGHQDRYVPAASP